jgi:hypothetical protein
LKDTAISIRRHDKRIFSGKCPSDPQALAVLIRTHAPERVVFETGPLKVSARLFMQIGGYSEILPIGFAASHQTRVCYETTAILRIFAICATFG